MCGGTQRRTASTPAASSSQTWRRRRSTSGAAGLQISSWTRRAAMPTPQGERVHLVHSDARLLSVPRRQGTQPATTATCMCFVLAPGNWHVHARRCARVLRPLTTTSPTSTSAPPPLSHAIAVFDACHMQCAARCAMRGACAEGRTGQRCAHVLHASTRRNTTLAPPPLPHSPFSPKHNCGQTRTSVHAGSAGRGTRRGPDVCPHAQFAEPQPLPRRTRSALPLHHCLSMRCLSLHKFDWRRNGPTAWGRVQSICMWPGQ